MTPRFLRVLAVVFFVAAFEYLIAMAADPGLEYRIMWGLAAVLWLAIATILVRLAGRARSLGGRRVVPRAGRRPEGEPGSTGVRKAA
jgi:hypothetical protein